MKKGAPQARAVSDRWHVVKNLVDEDNKKISEDTRVFQKRWIDESRRRVNKKITIVRDGRESVYEESVRMYSLREMTDMLSKAGLRLMETYGDFAGSEYSQDTPRMVLIGEKNG